MTNQAKTCKRRTGFTLTDLVFVITIVGIMVSVVIPVTIAEQNHDHTIIAPGQGTNISSTLHSNHVSV